jgi:hypothetical protein
MKEKLEQFRALFEADTIRGYLSKGYNLDLHKRNYEASVKIGSKYARVDRGGSGVYMVDLSTGEIFGVKAYGVIHRGHRYGTLDTINAYDWSGYRAHPKILQEAMDARKEGQTNYAEL